VPAIKEIFISRDSVFREDGFANTWQGGREEGKKKGRKLWCLYYIGLYFVLPSTSSAQ